MPASGNATARAKSHRESGCKRTSFGEDRALSVGAPRAVKGGRRTSAHSVSRRRPLNFAARTAYSTADVAAHEGAGLPRESACSECCTFLDPPRRDSSYEDNRRVVRQFRRSEPGGARV